jgi:hypothetical protein
MALIWGDQDIGSSGKGSQNVTYTLLYQEDFGTELF